MRPPRERETPPVAMTINLICSAGQRVPLSLAAARSCTYLECCLEASSDSANDIPMPVAVVEGVEPRIIRSAGASLEASLDGGGAAAVHTIAASLALQEWAQVCRILHFLGPTGAAVNAVAWVVDSLDPIVHCAGGGSRGIERFLLAKSILPRDAVGRGWAAVRDVLVRVVAALHEQPLFGAQREELASQMLRAAELDEDELASHLRLRLQRCGWTEDGEVAAAMANSSCHGEKELELEPWVPARGLGRKSRRAHDDPALAANGWDGEEELPETKRARQEASEELIAITMAPPVPLLPSDMLDLLLSNELSDDE